MINGIWGDLFMREILENYYLLFILMGLTGVSVLFRAVAFALFHRLLWDSNQMGTTDNQWMKSMMSKFEAYYKLRISVHNVENFVDRYLYHYHFLGLSLQTWENMGYYFMAALTAASGMLCMAGGYLQLSDDWFWVMGFASLFLLCIQGAAELFFNTHKCWKMLRIQVIDYMENTMRARLENEYFHQKATEQYQMEYFASEQGDAEDPGKETGGQTEAPVGDEEVAASLEKKETAMPQFRELLNTFMEEMRLDRDIAGRQRVLSEHAAEERAQLFEEILEEYL